MVARGNDRKGLGRQCRFASLPLSVNRKILPSVLDGFPDSPTCRIFRTPPELVSDSPICAEDHPVPAYRAKDVAVMDGRGGVRILQVLDVRALFFIADHSVPRKERFHDLRQLLRFDDDRLELLDILRHAVEVHDVSRHFGLEFRILRECDHREDQILRNACLVRQNGEVPEVLMNRILELELASAIQGLSPAFAVRIAENPTGIVLHFDYEYPEGRDNREVDLSRPRRRLEHEVADDPVAAISTERKTAF